MRLTGMALGSIICLSFSPSMWNEMEHPSSNACLASLLYAELKPSKYMAGLQLGSGCHLGLQINSQNVHRRSLNLIIGSREV
jgi:hypothetical protein